MSKSSFRASGNNSGASGLAHLPDGPFRTSRSRLALRAAVLGVATCALTGVALAADVDVVFDLTNNWIGVGGLPSTGVVGGEDQINYDPIASGGSGETQALTIDFGADVYDLETTFGTFLANDVGTGCAERGRWTAFSATGALIDSAEFVAGPTSDPLVIPIEPLRYIVFSAEPFDEAVPGCNPVVSGGIETSDYTIEELSYSLTDGGSSIPVTAQSVTDGTTPIATDAFLGYDTDEPFQDGSGNLLAPDGSRIFATIVIAPEACEGGTGSGSEGSCTIEYNNEFSSIIQNSADVTGSITILEIATIIDSRPACQSSPSGSPEPLTLNDYPADAGTGVLTIPAELCGIPGPTVAGVPGPSVIKLLVLESTLEVSRSVIEHLAQNPDNSDFECVDPATVNAAADPDLLRSRLPVIGWLPRFSDVEEFREIPVTDGGGLTVVTLQDVTTGPCGSTRGRTARMSHLAYNLRHLPATDYAAVIGADIEQLRTTLNQADGCSGRFSKTRKDDSVNLRKAARAFDAGKYGKAKKRLLKLRKVLLNDKSPLNRSFEECFYNFPSMSVVTGDDAGSVPRNFRGDLLSQVDHVLYMMEAMLGVLEPSIPEA